jgi:hypothetical protein
VSRVAPNLVGSIAEPHCSRYTPIGNRGAVVTRTAREATNYHAPKEMAVPGHREARRPPDHGGSDPRCCRYAPIGERVTSVTVQTAFFGGGVIPL